MKRIEINWNNGWMENYKQKLNKVLKPLVFCTYNYQCGETDDHTKKGKSILTQ